MILNGEAQMKPILVAGLHVLGMLGLAGIALAILAAPGFLSGSASTIRLDSTATVASR